MTNQGARQVRVALALGDLLGGLVTLVLRHIDADCRPAGSPAQLRSLIKSWSPEILLADLDGHERAPEWSADGLRLPCLGFTRKRDLVAKLAAFERGAHDIIEVPFAPDEIVVRTAAAYMRAHGRKLPVRFEARLGPFEMDLRTASVRVDSSALRLSPLEQTLLYLFLGNPGVTLTREGILANVWGSRSPVSSNVIDRHIRDLRVKLQEQWRRPRFIETVPGQGYRSIVESARGVEA